MLKNRGNPAYVIHVWSSILYHGLVLNHTKSIKVCKPMKGGQIVAVIGKNEKAINQKTLCFPAFFHSRATKVPWLSGCEKQFTPNCFIVQQLATIWKAPALLAKLAGRPEWYYGVEPMP